MKFLSRVVWSEGMYLGPQHFQIQNRYFEDSVRFAIEQTWFEPWGLSSYELDGSAIENGRVSLISAHGIFEDGLVFDSTAGCDPLPAERNIRDVFLPSAESLMVALAVPRWQERQQNCALNGNPENSRYRASERHIRDLNTGADGKPVKLCEKNIQIITQDEIGDDLLTIPLARIRRNGAGGFMYDPAFVPPCTKLTASRRLMDFLGQFIEIFEEKRKALMLPRKSGGFQAGLSQLEISNFWFLHAINDALAVLKHLHASKRGHPEELFRELSRVAGALCTFNLESDPNTLPLYDHRNLEYCFGALGQHIREHLEILVPSNTVNITIQPTPPNFYFGDVTDQRCFGRSRWIIGIGSSTGEAEVLTKAPYLVKVCSGLFVSELVRRAMPGLTLVHLPVPPSAISPRVDLQYFSISKSGPCWDHICDTRRVGIYIPNELPDAAVELRVVLES
ncbi:MAG: type VI secretion system baseplate subunit TssK [Candidatus Angelobacter sp. Gp1-AA117]|nr:MAG: type VI secretion system baseplate subunit TssK [Candidatus Angelobacter sp. Gp1-AA117]